MTRRTIVLATGAVALLVALAGCVGVPTLSTTGGAQDPDPVTVETPSPLTGTTWGGTDSAGDDWRFTFQDDGTVGLVLNGTAHDDVSDMWSVNGGVLSITIALDSGEAVFTGDYDPDSDVIDLDAVLDERMFTLTIRPA